MRTTQTLGACCSTLYIVALHLHAVRNAVAFLAGWAPALVAEGVGEGAGHYRFTRYAIAWGRLKTCHSKGLFAAISTARPAMWRLCSCCSRASPGLAGLNQPQRR